VLQYKYIPIIMYRHILVFVIKISIVLVCVLTLSLIFSVTKAQTKPQFIPFWRASAYAPAGFLGKVFPIEKTTIEASFELLNGGKLVDLSNKRIAWLVNGNVIKDGVNQKSVTFKNYAFAGENAAVDIRVFNPNGQADTYSFTIPVASPKLVIESPYDKDNLTGKNLNLTALPYFFNVSGLQELIFSWAVNGVSPEGNASEPEQLLVTIPGATPLGVRVTVGASVENPASSIETAQDELIYSIVQ